MRREGDNLENRMRAWGFGRMASLTPSRFGIGLRLLTLIVVFSSVVTLIATLLQLYFDYRRDISAIESRLDETASSYLGSLDASLWSLDTTQLKLQLNGILRLPDMQAAEVWENSEHPLVVAVGQRGTGRVIARQLPIIHLLESEKREIGTLYVEATLSDVYGRLLNTAIIILVSQGVKTFLVSLFTLYIFHHLVTRHLTATAHFLSGYDVRSPAPMPALLRRTKNADELGRMIDAFNATCTGLQDAYRELHDARAEAEDASRVKSEFLASMSHEIRTPLNGIIGFADLLLGTELTAEQRRYVTLQHGAGRGLLAIIGDILDYSKIEAGKLDLEERPFDLHRLTHDCRDLLGNAASQKGLLLQLALGETVPRFVRGDEARIRQILLNLVGNAVKFTTHGSVMVSIAKLEGEDTAKEARAGKIILRFSISDTGPGIPPAEQTRLFQAFSQGDSSMTRRFGGTGLGLIISKQLSELMGGRIGFESAPGVGSTFWFELPMPLAAEIATVMSKPEAERRQGASILLAEDVPMNQIVTSAILSKAGHKVVVVEDGVAAVEAVRGGSFDLVLMDVQMPRMDGLQATAAIRRLDGARGLIPIVALTANALADQMRRCLDVGMNDHVTKPVERETLLATVERWLGATDAQVLAEGEPSSSVPVLNRAALDMLAETLGEEALPRFLGGTLAELADRIDRILESGDLAATGFDAHAMASLAGNLGLVELSRLSRSLQQACEQGSPDIGMLKEQVRSAFDRGNAVLQAALPGRAEAVG